MLENLFLSCGRSFGIAQLHVHAQPQQIIPLSRRSRWNHVITAGATPGVRVGCLCLHTLNKSGDAVDVNHRLNFVMLLVGFIIAETKSMFRVVGMVSN